MAAENGAGGIIQPPKADEQTIHYLRLFFGQFTLTFGWHDALKAQKAHAEVERVRWWTVGGPGADEEADKLHGARPSCYVVDIADAFGNTGAVDVREVKASMLSSGRAASDLNYGMQFEDLKAKQRYAERLENDKPLSNFLRRMMQQGQQIIRPAEGGMQ
jgi:hypothetical protein